MLRPDARQDTGRLPQRAEPPRHVHTSDDPAPRGA